MPSDSIHLPVYTPLAKFWIHWLTATKSHSGKKSTCYQVPINSEQTESKVEKNYFLSAFLEDTAPIILDAHQQILGNQHHKGVEQRNREGQDEEISLL